MRVRIVARMRRLSGLSLLGLLVLSGCSSSSPDDSDSESTTGGRSAEDGAGGTTDSSGSSGGTAAAGGPTIPPDEKPAEEVFGASGDCDGVEPQSSCTSGSICPEVAPCNDAQFCGIRVLTCSTAGQTTSVLPVACAGKPGRCAEPTTCNDSDWTEGAFRLVFAEKSGSCGGLGNTAYDAATGAFHTGSCETATVEASGECSSTVTLTCSLGSSVLNFVWDVARSPDDGAIWSGTAELQGNLSGTDCSSTYYLWALKTSLL